MTTEPQNHEEQIREAARAMGKLSALKRSPEQHAEYAARAREGHTREGHDRAACAFCNGNLRKPRLPVTERSEENNQE